MGISRDIINLAKFMHDAYEEEAVKNGWQTQDSCKVKFADLPESNRLTMLAVAHQVIKRFKKEEKENE